MPGLEPLILVIEDEAPIRRFLRATLGAHGYRVNESASGKDGVIQAGMQPPHAVILDLGLPDMDGLEVLRELRRWSSVPVIVLSARGQESDKVAALDAGADDYLTKPFGVGELTARIRVALRHAARTGGAASTHAFGDIRVDLARRVVTRDGQEVRLTPTEYNLLALLVKHAGKVLTHRQLLTEVWGPSHAADVQYLRVFMQQLRHKLEAEPAQPRWLITESGVGYRLRDA
ncbi:MAG: response regulator [Planctomycetota bacterium]|nr:response regulator [Planctomycetota bacterium]